MAVLATLRNATSHVASFAKLHPVYCAVSTVGATCLCYGVGSGLNDPITKREQELYRDELLYLKSQLKSGQADRITVPAHFSSVAKDIDALPYKSPATTRFQKLLAQEAKLVAKKQADPVAERNRVAAKVNSLCSKSLTTKVSAVAAGLFILSMMNFLLLRGKV